MVQNTYKIMKLDEIKKIFFLSNCRRSHEVEQEAEGIEGQSRVDVSFSVLFFPQQSRADI